MAITQDGSEAFGITETTFSGFVVESFSKTSGSNRVDLDDGNGEPIGSTVVPGRVEGTLTVQVGSGGTEPAIGDEVTYGTVVYIVTEVALTESQADYSRYNLSVYAKINVGP